MNPVPPARTNRGAWLLIGLGLAVLMWGTGLFRRGQPQPEVMSCAAALNQRPLPKWLWLTNCQLDLADATGPANFPGQRPPELFVPVRGLGETSKANILLRTKSPIYVATFLQLQSFKSPVEARLWASRHADMVFPRRDARGMVRPTPAADALKFTQRPESLAAEFLLLEEGQQPRATGTPAFLALGAILVLAGGFFALQRR
jgi:hypothetical protein